MSEPTFTECKNILEDFYKQRKQFIISELEINQVDRDINIYSYINDIHFITRIKFKEDKFLITDLYKNLKPVLTYALSYTRLKKFLKNHPNFILTEDNTIINYNYEYIDHELYIKDLKVNLKTHYDFYDADYDLYFDVLAELENNNELTVSHEVPTTEEIKVINLFKIFKSVECVVCMNDKPNILFCNCGHLCECGECYKISTSSICPVCKTDNEIIRMLE